MSTCLCIHSPIEDAEEACEHIMAFENYPQIGIKFVTEKKILFFKQHLDKYVLHQTSNSRHYKEIYGYKIYNERNVYRIYGRIVRQRLDKKSTKIVE